jgi:uncharacterized protein (TIRG00374 family)
VLVGLGVTVASLLWVLNGVDFRQVGRDIARADLWVLLLPSVPAYLLGLWVRALRWRHLTDALAPVEPQPLFRAVVLGFMANNVFPLRLGELIRAFVLARDTGLSSGAVFGTVIVERLIDAAVILGLAAVVLGIGGAQALGIDVRALLPPLVALALVPTLFVAALRLAPERVIALVARPVGWLVSAGIRERLEGILRQVASGLGSLRGGSHLGWIAFHSVVIWLVLAPIPFAAALVSLGIAPGSLARTAALSFTLLVWIGAAVALPSAPGFFGPYHAACWLALRPFGVPKELALALGTLCHAVFWLTTTGLGLLVLRSRRSSLEALQAAATSSKDPG